MQVNQINNSLEVYKLNMSNTKIKPSKAVSKSDRLEISSTATDFASVLKAVSNTPDVREAKVNDVKARISSDNYYVKPEDIADKMLSNAFNVSV